MRLHAKAAGVFVVLPVFAYAGTCFTEHSRTNSARRSVPAATPSLPLKIYRNFLLVAEGQFGSALAHQNFVLDTGVAPSIVNARLAAQLGLVTTPSAMSAVGKIVLAQSAVLPEVEIGPVRAVTVRVQVQDLSRLERDIGIPVSAIIGLDVLSQASFRLDYDKSRIEFGDFSADGIPVSFDEHAGIAVMRMTFSGKPVRMLVDTGSDRVALFGRNFADMERFGLRPTSQQGSSLSDPHMQVEIFLAPDILLGGRHFALARAYFIPGSADPAFDGLLGVRALGFRAVAFDRACSTLYLQE